MTETEPQYSDAYRQAQQDMDAAWAAADAVSLPLKERFRSVVAELEGVTSMSPGPGADKLIDTLITLASQEANSFATLSTALASARDAEDRRDAARADLPEPAAPAEPVFLDTADPIVVREWLRTAGYAEVHDALTSVPDVERQKEWAVRLEEWARVDGNQSAVFEAIAAAVPTAPGTPAAQSDYLAGPPKEFASADDPPVGKGGVVDETQTAGGVASEAATDAATAKPKK